MARTGGHSNGTKPYVWLFVVAVAVMLFTTVSMLGGSSSEAASAGVSTDDMRVAIDTAVAAAEKRAAAAAEDAARRQVDDLRGELATLRQQLSRVGTLSSAAAAAAPAAAPAAAAAVAAAASGGAIVRKSSQVVRNQLNPLPRFPTYYRLLGCKTCANKGGRRAELLGECNNYKYDMTERITMAGAGQLFKDNDIWDTTWICKIELMRRFKQTFDYDNMQQGQTVNQVPRIRLEVSNKNTFCEHLAKVWGEERHEFFLPCFVMPAMEDSLLNFQQSLISRGEPLAWVLKASSGIKSSGGRGVDFLTGRLSQSQLRNADYVQWFLQPPALTMGKKFDLRVYATVPTFDPMRIYLYSQCYLRRTTVDFVEGDEHITNAAMHVVNHQYAVKQIRDVWRAPERMREIPFPMGNREDHPDHFKWGLRGAMAYFEKQGADPKKIWWQIREAIAKTLAAVEVPLSCVSNPKARGRYPCGKVYQQFGIDIMMDSNYKPYVLEVNTQPDMYRDSGTMSRIQGQMISDSWRLVGVIPHEEVVDEAALDALLVEMRLDSLSRENRGHLAKMLTEYAHRGGFDLCLPHPRNWREIQAKMTNAPADLYDAFAKIIDTDYTARLMRLRNVSSFRDPRY